jgi:hypothetical protein
MGRLRLTTLCIFFISLLSLPAYGWIKTYTKNGVVYIVGADEPEEPPSKALRRSQKFYEELKLNGIKEKVRFYAKKYNIPENLFLSLVFAESGFNPNAVSSKGAKGLCQLMPAVMRKYGVKNPFDVDENLNAGAKYLRELYAKYKSWKLAVAAYNAGEGAVRRFGGVPPYRETRRYVKKVFSGLSTTALAEESGGKSYRIVIRRVGDTVIISQEFLR